MVLISQIPISVTVTYHWSSLSEVKPLNSSPPFASLSFLLLSQFRAPWSFIHIILTCLLTLLHHFFSWPLFSPPLRRRAIFLKHKCDHVPPVLKNFSDIPCPQTPYMASKVLYNRNPVCLCTFSHPTAHPSFFLLYFSIPLLLQPYHISFCSLNRHMVCHMVFWPLYSVSSAEILFSPSFPSSFS